MEGLKISAEAAISEKVDNRIEQSYIGTKVVRGVFMYKEIFEKEYKNIPVGLILTPGYKVVYEDGYVSWSPKDIFERCYRAISDKEIDLIENKL